MRFFGINIEQSDDFSVHVDAEDKLKEIRCMPISRYRWRGIELPMKLVERKSFASVNASVGCLGIEVSPICS